MNVLNISNLYAKFWKIRAWVLEKKNFSLNITI